MATKTRRHEANQSALRVFVFSWLMMNVGACTAPGIQPAAMRPVTLPDLSKMSRPVQDQLREAHAALDGKKNAPGTSPRDLGSAYGELGNLLMAGEYLDAAEACYLNAEALAPDDMRWPYYLGHLHRTRGEPAEAAASFERARALAPNQVATLVWLGTVYLDQGRPEPAENLFAQAVALEPRSVAALSGQGRAALARRDFSKAVEFLEQALSIDSRATMLHYPLALAYRGAGALEKAEAHLRLRGDVEVAPTDPLMQQLATLLNSAAAHEKRGIRALDARDWAAAADAFRKAIVLEPASASLHHRLGTALSLAGDAGAAVAEFQEALRLSPGYAQAHFSLGVMLASAGRFAEAVERFAAAVKSEPSYADARLQLASALVRTGRIDEAHAQLAEGARTNPDRSEFARALEQFRSRENGRGRRER